MRILVLGGTVFLGRALTDAALAAGHDITHFNRGRAPDPRVGTVVGDRGSDGALRSLAGAGPWDAVIDTSGYLPQVVARSCAALHEAPRYVFVSSISVYTDDQGCDETSPVQPAPDPLPEAMTPDKYGALKAACEAVVRGAFGERSIVVRPGLIVGPHDPTDRFTWWPHRVALGGRVAAPGRPRRKVQFIDVRDLAGWMIALAAGPHAGTFNATGAPVAMGELLEACRTVSGSDARLEWIDEAFLAAHEVSPWKDMPVWLPEGDAGEDHFMKVPIARAVATGLRSRALRETLADTLAWSRTRDPAREWKAGLPEPRERDLLAAWDAAHAAD
jgi:2'-hydroxyisoflavone reductase